MASHLMSLDRVDLHALPSLISIPVCTWWQPLIDPFSSALTATYLTKTIVIFALVWTISKIVYNLYFHPLSSYPGPFLGRAFNAYISILELRGTQHTEVRKWHDTYGEVVRIAPNTLSYNSSQAWEEICGWPPLPHSFSPVGDDIDGHNV